ncbi:unnamed protein product, partial [Nesidiocoris tenuis]
MSKMPILIVFAMNYALDLDQIYGKCKHYLHKKIEFFRKTGLSQSPRFHGRSTPAAGWPFHAGPCPPPGGSSGGAELPPLVQSDREGLIIFRQRCLRREVVELLTTYLGIPKSEESHCRIVHR